VNESFEASFKNKRRSLSRFHAQEMLLSYALNQLDSERRTALDQYLLTCKNTKTELSAVQQALEYTQLLSELHVSQQLIEEMSNVQVGWAKWFEKMAWHNWPDLMRWLTEAVVVAGLVAAIVSLLPMQKLTNWLPQPAQEIVLSEVKPDVSLQGIEPDEISEAKVENKIASTPVQVAKLATSVPPVKEVPAVSAEMTDTNVSDVQPTQTVGKGPKSFVYRVFMATDSIDITTESVRETIMALDGAKAGQVDLGWRKNNGTYFHFTIPESNYETLLEGLRSFGPVRIYKDPHWRVMPEGQIRLILFVEDKGSKN
jgi:hypothetical protein